MQSATKKITHFWVQDEASAKHTTIFRIKTNNCSGDSRFDRVYTNTQK